MPDAAFDDRELATAMEMDLDLLIELYSNVEKPSPMGTTILRLAIRCKVAEEYLKSAE